MAKTSKDAAGLGFTLETAALKGYLQMLGESVAKRTTVPALAQVLVGARAGTLTLATCDTRVYQSIQIVGAIDNPLVQDAFLVDWARLNKFVGSVGGKEIAFAHDGKGKVTVRSGSITASLGTLTAETFPRPWSIKEPLFEGEIDAAETAAALKAAGVAASSDDSRPVFCSVRWRIAQGMALDATDGYRLHRVYTTTPDLAVEIENLEMIVPADSIGALQGILQRHGSTGNVLLTVAQNTVRLTTRLPDVESTQGVVYTAQASLRDAKFPDIEPMVPKSCDLVVTAEIKKLLETLEVSRDFVASNVNLLTLCVRETPAGDFLTVVGQSETDQFAARLECGVTRRTEDAAPVLLGINVGLFVDAIKSLQGTDSKAKQVQLFHKSGKLPLFMALANENPDSDPLLESPAFAIVMPMHVPGGITFDIYTGDYAARDGDVTWLSPSDTPEQNLDYVPEEADFDPVYGSDEVEPEPEIAF